MVFAINHPDFYSRTSWKKTGTPKTEGEQVFEAYLAERDLAFEYEPDLGAPTRPDYLLHSPVQVLCDVKDFDEGEEDRRFRKAVKESAAQGPDYYSVRGI